MPCKKNQKKTCKRAVIAGDLGLVSFVSRKFTIPKSYHWAPNEQMATFLFDHEKDVNSQDFQGLTPLGWATAKFNLDFVKTVLNKGANVNATMPGKITPLHLASDVHVTNELIKHGANVDAVDDWGRTPLLYAMIDGKDFGVVKALLDAGSDINTQFNSHSLLHLADSFEVVKELLLKGADVNYKNKNGDTPLDLARKHRKSKDICDELVKYHKS